MAVTGVGGELAVKFHPVDRAFVENVKTVIAEETERERSLQRRAVAELSPGASEAYFDGLQWDELLTYGECSERCAKRLGVDVEKVVFFAVQFCKPTQSLGLHWYVRYLLLQRAAAKVQVRESVTEAAYAVALAREVEFKARSGKGGRKSGETRRLKALIPADEVLLADRNKKLATGRSSAEANADLARLYGVTKGAVRNRVREALKRI